MTLIHVPRPKSAWNPDRPVNALLKVQMEHLSNAERRLPLRFRSEIYVNAIQTEGEAAEYIRKVTEAIQAAHAEAAAKRAKPAAIRKRVIEIAAVADERVQRRQRRSSTATKSKKIKRGGGKKSTAKR